MKTQLKIAATLALTAAGFIATAPAQAFPSSAIEYSKIDAYQDDTPAKRITLARATRTTVATLPTYEPISD